MVTTTKPDFRYSYRSDGTFLMELGDETIELDMDQTMGLMAYVDEIMSAPGDDDDEDDEEDGDLWGNADGEVNNDGLPF